jgi:hypothetical protein
MITGTTLLPCSKPTDGYNRSGSRMKALNPGTTTTMTRYNSTATSTNHQERSNQNSIGKYMFAWGPTLTMTRIHDEGQRRIDVGVVRCLTKDIEKQGLARLNFRTVSKIERISSHPVEHQVVAIG